jgi:photosystem II stability/assembly factor-like uncharacterized protein
MTAPPEKQNPSRIVLREKEETRGIFADRLYRYSSTPWGWYWELIDTCLEGRIVDAYFLSKQAWVLSDQGEIGISTDGGIKWKPYKLGLRGSLSTLYFMDNSNGWMVLNDRTLLTTHDGGLTWSKIADAFTQARVTQLHFNDLNHGWAVAEKYKSPLFTIDGGRTWSTPENNSGDLESIYFFDEANGWAIRRGIGIVHTSDGGKTWVHQGIEYPWSYNNPIHYIYEVPLLIAAGVVLTAELIVVLPFAYVISKFAKPSSPCQQEEDVGR